MGLLPSTASLAEAEHIPASAFARRRLPIVLVRLKFCETVKEAVTFVEHGHVRVGPEVVTGERAMLGCTCCSAAITSLFFQTLRFS